MPYPPPLPFINLWLNKDRTTSKIYCDITLIANGLKYPARICVLSRKSTFFEKFFCLEMKKYCGDVVVIEEFSRKLFEAMLDFTYTARFTINFYHVAYRFANATHYLGLKYGLNPV